MSSEGTPLMPVRRLHNFVYCPRLFYYQWVEGVFIENSDTVDGSLIHCRADKPGRMTTDLQGMDLPEGTVLRSLQVDNIGLGLTGKIDVCELGENGVEIVDYKKGVARRDQDGTRVAKQADKIQVAAYALLLKAEGVKVEGASIYYAEERRRVKVDLNDTLFEEVRNFQASALRTAREVVCPPPLRG